jgi:predicted patatin/cPLA2 family phospholipase
MNRARRGVLLSGLSLGLLAGCSIPVRLNAVPRDEANGAEIPGIPDARFFPDTQLRQMTETTLRVQARHAARWGTAGVTNMLAISGGADDGAFGAGLLCGWTGNGTRPVFDLVTGISTGALTAPFAYLGPAWDGALREVFTGVRPESIFSRNGLLWLLFSEALTDTTPLFGLISQYVDQRMMDEVAAGYADGRMLLIGTTNLDEQRPVIWNMGAIAASGHPSAIDLFRRILLASSAVPGVFPPVMIDVEAGGRHYQEMHVDGGVVAQTFLYPSALPLVGAIRRAATMRERRAYIIRNGRLDAEWASVDRRFTSIARRAISAMIHWSGNNDILRMQAITARDGVQFNLAYIGSDFTMVKREDFDQDYMRALFDYGYRQGLAGYRWKHTHPSLFVPYELR